MSKWDKVWIGFTVGMIGPWIGIVIFYLLQFSHMKFAYFIEHVVVNNVSTELLSLGAVMNLLLFFIQIWKERAHSARGVILATMLYAFVVLVIKLLE